MRSYVPDQWLRSWFLGGESDVTYTREGQVPHASEDAFTKGLAQVWKNVARVVEPRARMVIRFGALPSAAKDPVALLRRSLREADAGWKIATVKSAGRASYGKRQSEQFGRSPGNDVDEIDLYAQLT
jgi:hypothetical protein